MKQELIVQTVWVSILPLRWSGCGVGWVGFTCMQCSARWFTVSSCSWVPPSPGWTVSKETCKDVGNLDIILWSWKESKHFGVIYSAQALFPTAVAPDELSFRAAGQWGCCRPPCTEGGSILIQGPLLFVSLLSLSCLYHPGYWHLGWNWNDFIWRRFMDLLSVSNVSCFPPAPVLKWPYFVHCSLSPYLAGWDGG